MQVGEPLREGNIMGTEDIAIGNTDAVNFAERVEKVVANREDLDVFGVKYIPLPLDADGVPCNFNDRLRYPDGREFDVSGIGQGDTLFYVDGDEQAWWTSAADKLHVEE